MLFSRAYFKCMSTTSPHYWKYSCLATISRILFTGHVPGHTGGRETWASRCVRLPRRQQRSSTSQLPLLCQCTRRCTPELTPSKCRCIWTTSYVFRSYPPPAHQQLFPGCVDAGISFIDWRAVECSNWNIKICAWGDRRPFESIYFTSMRQSGHDRNTQIAQVFSRFRRSLPVI